MGATPVFCDICGKTYLIDALTIPQLITPQTKARHAHTYALIVIFSGNRRSRLLNAVISLNEYIGFPQAIIVVALFGQMANMKQLCGLARLRGLYVVEDAAQSFGASQVSTHLQESQLC